MPVAISPKSTVKTTWVPDNPVFATACDPVTGITYVAGQFQSWGPNTGCGAPVNLTTGLVDPTFPKINNYGENQGSNASIFGGNAVMCAAADGSGGWYVGGQFTAIGGISRWAVAHVNANNTVDETFNAGWVLEESTPDSTPTVAAIYSMYFDGGNLWVAGTFNFIGGMSHSGLAVLNGVTGAVVSPDFDPDGDVFCVTGGGSGIWVGGDFQTISGAPRNRLVNYSGVGNLGSFDANINPLNSIGAIHGMYPINNTQLAITGIFTNVNGVFRNNAAIIDLGTGFPTSFDPNLNDMGYSIVVDTSGANIVYICGQFLQVNLVPTARRYLAAFDISTGAVVTTWDPNPDDWVYSLELGGSNLYASGIFTSIVATTRWGLAALSKVSGSAVSVDSWNPHPSDISTVRAIKIEGANIFVGGTFTSLNAITTGPIAGLNTDGISVVSLAPGPTDQDAHSLLLTAFGGETKLIYGYLGAGATDAIKMIDTSGNLDWSIPTTGSVQVIHRIGTSSTIYIGGEFTAINGTARAKLAELNLSDGSLTVSAPASFTGSEINTITSIGASPTSLYVGGNFSNINGVARVDAADVSLSLSSTGSWNPAFNSTSIYKILPSYDESFLFVAGDFTTVNSGAFSASRVAGVNLTDGTYTGFNANPTGSPARDICLGSDGTRLYISGDFGSASIKETNASTGAFYGWNPLTQTQPPLGTTFGGSASIYLINYNSVTNSILVGGDLSEINGIVQPFFALWQFPHQINIVGKHQTSGQFVSLLSTDTSRNSVDGPIFVTGIMGITGMRGATGFSPKGPSFPGLDYRGATGLQGIQGLTGSDGIAVIGTTGFAGETGISTAMGETGIQGATGLQGSTGLPSYYPLRIGTLTGISVTATDNIIILNRNFVADLFPLEVNLPSAVTVGAGKTYSIRATLGSSSRDVILKPAGGQTINGLSSLVLPWGFSTIGQYVDIYSNGANYFARGALIGVRGATGVQGITGIAAVLDGVQGITGVNF